MAPTRIQLSRAAGWRMPPNTVKVDRSTMWGNPFIVGIDGTAVECVYWLIMLTGGYICLSASRACVDRQDAFFKALIESKKAGYIALRGKNLACWCHTGKPCHGDVLLQMVNKKRGRVSIDIDDFIAQYGYRFVDGKAQRLEQGAAA